MEKQTRSQNINMRQSKTNINVNKYRRLKMSNTDPINNHG